MKSLVATHPNSACSSPTLHKIYSEVRPFPQLRHTHNPHNKTIEYIASTLQSLTSLSRTTSANKQSKASITVTAWTREKVRAGQRGFKKKQSKQMLLTSISSKGNTSSKKQIDVNRSKHYIQFFTMLAFMYNKSKQNSHKIDFLIEQFISFFGQKREKQFIVDIQEITAEAEILKSALFTDAQKMPYQIIKNCKGELSKLFFNICFELYLYKKNTQTFLQLDIIHRDIEYYSRRLGMLNLTVVTCMDMGRLCLQFFEFEKASQNYSKALKLAVYKGDKYRQQICIDKLGLCEYYRGDMVSAHYYHSSVNKLSAYNKLRIRQHYSNEKQIQKILEEKTKEKSHQQQVKEQFFKHNKENSEFNFDSSGIDYEYTQKNYDHFRNNLKEMIKINTLRKKVPMIKNNLQRTFKIGEKKFKGNNYIIPKASKFHLNNKERSQDEFMLTHRSFNRSNINHQSHKIDKYCKIIEQMVNFFVTDLKNRAKAIIEQRESSMSQERE